MSLPNIFQTRVDSIPTDIPYLNVPSNVGKDAVAIVTQYSEFRVGLVWTSNSPHPNKEERCIKLEQLRQLLMIDGIKFFSLQNDLPSFELSKFKNIIDLQHHLRDFAITAAVIQNLDLVISIDTAVAHLAGGLGKPVWTLIPFANDWRWMLNREDSPWYPTMCLFRQPRPGDWTSVIARVAAQLTELARQQSAT